MASASGDQYAMGVKGSSGNVLATVPNLSDKIIKSDAKYCKAGGFSDVYKRQYDSGAELVEVAVKSFRFFFMLDNRNDDSKMHGVQKMIRRELGIWRRLQHPNIVPFMGITYGFGGQGHVSLVSLWMANGSLQSLLGEYDDRLTIPHRLRLLSDIACGLCYLHSFVTPIIHGDLSCNNVLLDDEYTARLTDFGYASMIGDMPEAALYLQMTTMKPGTLRWAAPEHFLADVDQPMEPTTQSDIYSFGNIGLFVLSGKHPWSEIQRETAIILQLSRGSRPKRPSSRSIEDQHWELIERCWAPVGHRPAAEDVASCIQQFLHSFPSPLSLVDIFCTTDHKSTESPDDSVPTTSRDIQLGTSIRWDREVVSILPQELDSTSSSWIEDVTSELVPDTKWPDLHTEHLCNMFIRSIAEGDPESTNKRALRLGKAFVIELSQASDKISARFGQLALRRITALVDPDVDPDLRLIIAIVVKLLSNSIRTESPMEFPATLEVSQSLLGWLLQPLETLLQQNQSLFLPEAYRVLLKLKWPEDSTLQRIDEVQYCRTFEACFNIIMSSKIGQTDETTGQSLEDKAPVERLKDILEKLKKLDPTRLPVAYHHLIVPLTVLSRLTSISQFKQAIKDATIDSWMLAAFKEAVGKAEEGEKDMWLFVGCLVQLATDVDAFSSIEGQVEKDKVGNGEAPSPPLRMDSASLLSYLFNGEFPATSEHVASALQIVLNNVDEHLTLASNPRFVNYILYATGPGQSYSIRDIGLKVLVATCQSLLRAYDATSLVVLATKCDLVRFIYRAIHHQETMLQSILETDDEVLKEGLLGILAPALGDPFNMLLIKLREEPNKIPERDLRDLEIALVLSNGEGRRKLLFDYLDRCISGQTPLWDTMALPLTVIVGWLLRRGGPVNSAEGIVKSVLRPNLELLLIPAWGDPNVLEDNPQLLRLLLECTTRWLPIYVSSRTGESSQSETTLARLQQAVDQLRKGNRALSMDIKRALQRLYREIDQHNAETRI